MNSGAFGENFPYSNFHDLNMDWIIKIAKDFLDQYTHIQEVIDTGLQDLENKANTLEQLLQDWYDTHSADIQNQLADALEDLNNWYNQHQGYLDQYVTNSINAFNTAADQKTAKSIASIPSDYSTLSHDVNRLKISVTHLNDAAYIATGNLLDFGIIGDTWEQGGIGNSNLHLCRTKPFSVEAGRTLYGVISKAKMQETTALSTFLMRLTVTVYDANNNVLVNDVNLSNSRDELTGRVNLPVGSDHAIAVLTSGVLANHVTPSMLDNATEAFAYLGYSNITKDEVVPNYVSYPEYNDNNIQKLENTVELYNDTLIWIHDTEISLTPEAGIVSVTGYVNTGSTDFVHYNIPVTAGQHYQVQSYEQGNTNYPFVLFYNANNTIIGNMTDGSSSYTTKDFIIPDNVTKMCINGSNTDLTHVYTLKTTNTQEYIDNVAGENYWKGKKIVWFGTSIPAGVINAGDVNGNGAYPTRVGELLGATVYNEAIGSSRVRGGNYHAISANDPMGWSGCEAIGVMLSLSLSRAEKQEIINNWDSKWKNIMINPSQYDASQTSRYLNSSWDTILTKYLTGGSIGQCDLYVFDHGYNDGIVTYGFTDLDEIPAQKDNRTYWWGAMNFLVSKILSDNPKAKILIIGHYNYSEDQSGRGANWAGKYVCDAQKAYAEAWGLTCIETWKLLGLSMNEISINGTQTPVIYARYPDHIHPASDATGYELKRYAEALAPYFKLASST